MFQSRQLESDTGTTEEHSLNKEARKWATRMAREHKNIIHHKRVRHTHTHTHTHKYASGSQLYTHVLREFVCVKGKMSGTPPPLHTHTHTHTHSHRYV